MMAAAAVWVAGISVLATLRMEAVLMVAIALGLVDMIKFLVIRMCTPLVLDIIGPQLQHWCTTIITLGLVAVMLVVASLLQLETFTALYAAVRGGRLFADGLFGMLVEQAKAGTSMVTCCIGADFDMEESVLDEMVGFLIGMQGLMFQLSQDYTLPFPLNLVLLPLTLVDMALKSQLSGGCVTSLVDGAVAS